MTLTSTMNTTAWQVFTTCPRQAEVATYLERMRRTLSLTQSAGFAGMLIYTGNDVAVEPLLVAAEMARDYPGLSPFIAVNPIYMHPFTLARCVATLANVYGARCHLNFVAGTSLTDLAALDEVSGHDDRYARLREFALIVRDLCLGHAAVSLDGQYFGARGLRLPAPIAEALQPVAFVAGQSNAAWTTAQAIGAHSLGMLQPNLEVSPASATSVHMAIVCRETDDKALAVARRLFPALDILTPACDLTRSTDSTWRAVLMSEALEQSEDEGVYWLGPFRRRQLDCPLLVGSIRTISACLTRLAAKGVTHLVLELPDSPQDFEATAEALSVVSSGALLVDGAIRR